ncbi:DUF6443 domain-containing protein [Sinomicrobium weinanense]|uniref:DUF6443 domain-containing protein n=1 Tax=Sinomicrobium weinanense TaxID=2842200 RepID=A0A926Q3J4_9FLAO|nr:DUF6443 domain-containing protein [Sinomicrobium weinanense]MBC9795835.1 hypothetical protein [Sinomicrobium weinanense]MBU3125355.1 hypothetical protein [Sinomicrobium weinanense]
MPTIVKSCEETTLTRSTPPGGVTWYWQSSSGGTSTSNSSASIIRTSGTVYYLRARNNSSGCWSAARTINYTINQKQTWYADFDGDGFGDLSDMKESCTPPDNYVKEAGDNCPDVWGEVNGCLDEDYKLIVFSNENYIYTRSYQKGMTSPGGIKKNEDVLESVVYYDGLGRPKQEVSVRQSPRMQDVVHHIGYDGFGRKDKEYLPFVLGRKGNYGTFRNGNIADSTGGYYQSHYAPDFLGMDISEVNAYSQKEFEASPLNRVKKQAAPGKAWKLSSGHEIEFDYGTNTATEVRRYEVDLTVFESNTAITYIPSLVLNTDIDNGDYKAGKLYKTITYDENHSGTGKDYSTEEFKDKQGRVVLKRTYNNAQRHDTYYVYDAYGNLTYVLPPKAEAHSAKPNATKLKELCYQYVYDGRNRLVEKKIPGKAWEYIVYNKLDQPVLTQDSLLRFDDKWLFTKYDAFGRVAYTGVKKYSNGRKALQHAANNKTFTQYEIQEPTATEYAEVPVFYSNKAIPKTMDELHTINYYDTYVGTAGLSVPATIYGKPRATNTKGLATVSKVRVLGTDHWITSITGYDNKGRVIYTASKNPYLNTTDIVEYKLDFTGKVLESKTTHTKGSNEPIVTIDKFEYDHAGRLIRQLQCINGDCGGSTSGEDLVLNSAVTGTTDKVAGKSIRLTPGFHIKATSSVSFSASISPSGELIAENIYDDLGQLKEKKVGNTPGKPLQTVKYTYNVRGWLKEINDVDNLGNSLFGFQINYNTSRSGAVSPLYNGNIAETYWKTKNDNTLRRYAYTYDALNRITSGLFNNAGSTAKNHYTVKDIAYDKNGNITDLTRAGWQNSDSYTDMDVLDYRYNSTNRLSRVIDTGNKSYGFKDGTNTNNDYTYDANGNLTSDANKGITGIAYNHLNLPTKVTVNNPEHTGNIEYIYGADGVKLKKVAVDNGKTTSIEYANGYIYENGSLAFFSHPEGYVTKENNTFKYMYQYKDHLGNIRLSYANMGTTSAPQLEVIEENNYYPFGLKHRGYNPQTSPLGNSVAQRWKFNGIELEESLGLNLYEMEFRNYDATIGRFMNVDPLAEERISLTPYNFTQNNPVLRIDPLGLLDTYGLEKDGNVVWLDATTYYDENGNEVDRLYAIDDDKNIVESSTDQEYATAKVDEESGKSFLSELASDNTGVDYGVTQSISDAFDVFKFAADNSDVEWSVQGYQLDNDAHSYAVLTSHAENYAGNGYHLGLFGGYEIENLLFDIHSHPKTKGASGYKSKGFPFTGDKNRQYNHKEELDKKGLPLPLYYIYHKPSRNMYRYTPTYGDRFIKNIKKSSDFYTGKYK